jgi:hypothetical protein
MIALVHIRETYELANCTRLGSAVQLKNHEKRVVQQSARMRLTKTESKNVDGVAHKLIAHLKWIIDVCVSLNALNLILTGLTTLRSCH